MLHELVASNQDELIRRCREKAAQRFDAANDRAPIDHGVPLFLTQLIDTLRHERETSARDVSSPEPTPAPTAIGRAAALHGAELLRAGYSIDQVVHEYGDICQSVTGLAVELNEKVSAEEFRTLNRCLDDAIADAVTSFASAGHVSISEQDESLRDRLNAFAVEHRRLVDAAVQSFSALRMGKVGVNGTTGRLLGHTLDELRSLPERSLSEIDDALQ
jgi:hypothetical protein